MKSLAVALCALPVLLAAAPSSSPNGRWWGRYEYQEAGRPVVTFRIDVTISESGVLTGTSEEEASDFGPTTRHTAKLSGTYLDGELKFLKVYDFDPTKMVEYRGVRVGDEISGTWTVPGTTFSGRWFVRRAPKEKAPPKPPKAPPASSSGWKRSPSSRSASTIASTNQRPDGTFCSSYRCG